jgi:hypothetical protein
VSDEIKVMVVQTTSGPRYYRGDGVEMQVIPAFQPIAPLPGYCAKCGFLIPVDGANLAIHPDYICKCDSAGRGGIPVSGEKRIEELLERVAAELDDFHAEITFEKQILAVLRRELLPLLKAGQEMRDGVIGASGGLKRIQLARAWDAALGGSEESDDAK